MFELISRLFALITVFEAADYEAELELARVPFNVNAYDAKKAARTSVYERMTQVRDQASKMALDAQADRKITYQQTQALLDTIHRAMPHYIELGRKNHVLAQATLASQS